MQQPVFAIYLLWLVWFLSWVGAALLTGSTRRLTLAQDVVYRTMVLIASVMLLFGFLPDPGFDVRNTLWQPQNDELGWVLVSIVFVAFCFAWWARFQLGFSLPGSAKKPEVFCESGPYKWIRHPIYGSLIIAAVATSLLFGRPSSMAGAALLALAFVLKILIEEGVLRSESGSFDDYTDRVPMLVPFLPKRQKVATRVGPLLPRSVEEKPKPEIAIPPTLVAAVGTPVAAGPQLSLPLTPPAAEKAAEAVAPEPAADAEPPAQPALSDAMSMTKR